MVATVELSVAHPPAAQLEPQTSRVKPLQERRLVPEPERRYTLWSPTTFIYPSGEGWIIRSLEVNEGKEVVSVVEFFSPQEIILSAIEVREDAPQKEFYRSIYTSGLFFVKSTPTTRPKDRGSLEGEYRWLNACICCGHPAYRVERRIVFDRDGTAREEGLQDRLYCVPLFADFNLPNEDPRKRPGCNALLRTEETLGVKVRTFLPLGWGKDAALYRAFKIHGYEVP